MTPPQRRVVERLLAKGWIEPLHYRSCVYLFLPEIQPGRQGRLLRNWRRKPIRVTPGGRVLPGQTADRTPSISTSARSSSPTTPAARKP